MRISLPAAVLLWTIPHLACAQIAILHIRILEGDGTVNVAGARNPHPLAVEITDETGKPVEGASVSFHLPEEGPGGTFGNGLRTEVMVTDVRGRASLHALECNRVPGRMEIRIVAAKEQARAGTVAFQYIAGPKGGGEGSPRPSPTASRGRLKWVVLAALAAGGAAAAGVLASRGTVAGNSSAPLAISIGSPAITVGHP